MPRTTAVSIVGMNYPAALAALAAKKRRKVGAMVREAIDEKWGEELKPLLAYFDASSDQQNDQSDNSVTTGQSVTHPSEN